MAKTFQRSLGIENHKGTLRHQAGEHGEDVIGALIGNNRDNFSSSTAIIRDPISQACGQLHELAIANPQRSIREGQAIGIGSGDRPHPHQQ